MSRRAPAGATGLPVSPDTLLRLLRRTPVVASGTAAAPRVLGVDDWAWKKGRRYGTVLVDLERRQIVDLLPDRSAAGVAQWLAHHRGVEVAARDRAGAFAEGLRQGAPEAVQVADRWHLVKNAGETLERVLQRHHADLRALARAAAGDGATPDTIAPRALHPERPVPGAPVGPPSGAPAGTGAPPAAPLALAPSIDRERRRADYERVVALHDQGGSVTEISRQVGRSRATVRKYLRAGAVPERAPSRRWRAPTAAEAASRQQRWAEGCHTAAVLWRELRAQGYRGSSVTVRRYVAG